MPERRTREGVEIARVGTFNLSTGSHTFTKPQLAAAVSNAGRSPQGIRLGIGHIDPRFNQPGHDGDPAFGRVVNLRLAEDGELLLGDYADVPEWLDANMDVAYPGRSLEGPVSGDDLTIRSVKLLGTTPPGIATLADLEQAIAAAGDTSAGAQIVTGNLREARVVAAATNLDDLREAFYAAHPTSGNDGDWWGVQEVQINPNQLIVEHKQKTYRVAWAVNTDGTFTFGDMQEVAVQYVDVAAASGEHAVVYRAPVIRPSPKPKEQSMDPKILRTSLGLAEDASDDDVTAKLAEFAARPDEAAVTAQVEAAAEKAKTEAIAASGGDGETVKLDKETFANLKASAEKGEQAFTTLAENERTTFIAAAVGKGKFPPSRVDHYTNRYKSDPDGTRAEIDALAEGVVPVEEIGASGGSDEDDTILTTGLFPQLQEA